MKARKMGAIYMEVERAYIEELVSKLKEGTLSESELHTLIAWYNDHDDTQYAFDSTFAANAEALKMRLQHKILARINQRTEATQPVKKKNYGWLKIAAAVFAIGTAMVLLTYVKKQFKEQVLTASEIKPGYNQAVLTLADGRTINLDSAQSGIIIGDEHIKYQSGESLPGVMLSEGSVKGASGAETSLPTSLTLSTPKGGQYQIILSDGTKVWLNAASTLKYPSKFTGDRREVFLDGEGYFEVNNKMAETAAGSRVSRGPSVGTRDTRAPAPFIVKSKNQEILVLGTSFNISSYEGEESVKTTLVTGTVQVSQAGSELSLSPSGGGRGRKNGVILKPGEQSILSEGKLSKQKADIYSATAWKNNKFSFDNKTFEQVMRELGRWYNLDIRYEGPVPTATLFGDAYRNNNLSFVLKLLDNGSIQYELQGRTLIIKWKGGAAK